MKADATEEASRAGGADPVGGGAMDIQEVLRYLPHRYPFLLVDRVLACVPGESLVAVKNVTFNEPFFTGHFPGHPIMPGVLIIEAIAQATGILAFRTAGTTPQDGTIYYLAAVDNARFKQPVLPGDQLRLEVRLERALRGVWMFAGRALVEGRVAASCELKCARRELPA